MSNNLFVTIFLVFAFLLNGCSQTVSSDVTNPAKPETADIPKIKNPARIIHVLAALCDNENQGIVPVPAFLGNGEVNLLVKG